MPRIAHVISTPSGVGGAESVLALLISRGHREGWEQIVLNPFADEENVALRDRLNGTDYKVHRGSRLRDLWQIRRWLRRELAAFGPDLVHAHLFHAMAAVASLRVRGSATVVTHHHGDFLRSHGRRIEEVIDRVAGRRFDSVVAVSEYVRRFLVQRYRYPPGKVVAIRNGWTGVPLPRQAQEDLPCIVSVGNLRVEKGHGVLLRAFARVAPKHPATLVLVGDGPLRASLESETVLLGIEDRVRFVGTVANVWPILSKADLFVLPSLSENLGIAVLEAMAAGVPVIASDVGGVGEVVTDGKTGLLVPANDEAALADRLDQLLTAGDLRREMGKAGQAAAEGMKMETTIDSYVIHYETLLARRERAQF